MNAGARILCALAAAMTVVAVALGCGEEQAYHVRLELPNAGGLRDGAEVAIGGVAVGKVSLDVDRGRRRVIADLQIEEGHVPVDRGVRAAISAVNLLGLKRVDLLPPTERSSPAPNGFVIPASRVTVSTDLDQVLDVLDPDTRTRLAVLVNEAGAGFAGRGGDFSQFVSALPHSLSEATRLLDQVVSDNRTLGELVEHSDGFLQEVTVRRRALSRLVRTAAGTAETVTARRAELGRTLARAPKTMSTLRSFLAELGSTANSLGPAARDITAAAPALSATLRELEPFRRAAQPALREAHALAPRLTSLARGAAPVVDRARPTVRALSSVSHASLPVSRALDDSADNIVAILENWSRAIQFRDGLSHVFRGEATFTADTLMGIIDRLAAAKGKRGKPQAHGKPRKRTSADEPKRGLPGTDTPRTELPGRLGPVVNRVDGVLDALRGVAGKRGDQNEHSRERDGTALLDFLLKP